MTAFSKNGSLFSLLAVDVENNVGDASSRDICVSRGKKESEAVSV